MLGDESNYGIEYERTIETVLFFLSLPSLGFRYWVLFASSSRTFKMKENIQLIVAKHLRDELDVHVFYVDVLIFSNAISFFLSVEFLVISVSLSFLLKVKACSWSTNDNSIKKIIKIEQREEL